MQHGQQNTRIYKKYLMTEWQHIISACPMLEKEQYIKRHDRVCAELHFNICKETGVKLDNKHGYDHAPKSVEISHAGKVAKL